MEKRNYTKAELLSATVTDLLNDAAQAEEQAANGPYYMDNVGRRHFQPERVLCSTDAEREISKAELLAYAEECRSKAANLSTPNA